MSFFFFFGSLPLTLLHCSMLHGLGFHEDYYYYCSSQFRVSPEFPTPVRSAPNLQPAACSLQPVSFVTPDPKMILSTIFRFNNAFLCAYGTRRSLGKSSSQALKLARALIPASNCVVLIYGQIAIAHIG